MIILSPLNGYESDKAVVENHVGSKLEYFEEFPFRMIHRFQEITGKSISSFVLINYQYNSEYSGPGIINYFCFKNYSDFKKDFNEFDR